MQKVLKKFSVLSCQLFLLLLFFFVPFQVHAQNATYILKPNMTSPKKGDIYKVSVYVNSTVQINSVHIELSYSPAVLTVQDISFKNSAFPGVIEKINKDRQIKLTAYTITPFKGNNSLVATIAFKVTSSDEIVISLSPASKIHAGDGTGKNILDKKNSTTYLKVQGTSQAGTNSPTAGESPATNYVSKNNNSSKTFLTLLIILMVFLLIFSIVKIVKIIKKPNNATPIS